MKAITTTMLILGLLISGCEQESGQRDTNTTEQSSQGTKNDARRKMPTARGVSLPGVQRFADARLGDWNGNGLDDLLIIQDGTLLVAGLDGTILNRKSVSEGRLNLVVDVDGDGRAEIFLSGRHGRDLTITAMNQQFRELRRFQTTGGTHRGRPDSGIRAERMIDLDGDGHLELLAIVGTGYGWKPRGVYCFDFETGGLHWRHLTAPGVTDIQVLDVDGDGVLDVVFGTYSPGNGNHESDGTDDMHCYVHAVSGKGKLLWIRPMGGNFTGAYPLAADIDADGERDIIVRVEAGPDFRSEVGQLVCLDRMGRPTARFDAGRMLRSSLVVDLNGDGRPEILATDRLGALYVLGSNLSLVRKIRLGSTQYESVFADLAGAGDLDGDGRPEVVLTYREREFVSGRNPRGDMGPRNVRHFHNIAVVVLDTDLLEVARYPIAKTWTEDRGHRVEIRPIGPDGGQRLVSLTDHLTLIDYALDMPPLETARQLPDAADDNAASLAEVRRQLGKIINEAVETKEVLLKAKFSSQPAPNGNAYSRRK